MLLGLAVSGIIRYMEVPADEMNLSPEKLHALNNRRLQRGYEESMAYEAFLEKEAQQQAEATAAAEAREATRLAAMDEEK